MNTLSTISLVLGIILSAAGVAALIMGFFAGLRAIKEGIKALLRDKIEEIYYQNLETKTLKAYQRKNLDSLYEAYHRLKGNSFASDIYNEMREWEVVR